MISRFTKKRSKRIGKSEKRMWKEFAKRLQELLLHQNKTLYEVAHEKDRLQWLISQAIVSLETYKGYLDEQNS